MVCYRLSQINGQLQVAELCSSIAETSAVLESRAIRYGHGVFETLKIQAGRIVLLAEHLQRLHQGALALGFLQNLSCMIELVNDCLSVQNLLNPTSKTGVIRIALLAEASVNQHGYAFGEMKTWLLQLSFTPAQQSNQAAQQDQVTALRIAEPMYPWPKALVGLKLINAFYYVHWAESARAQGYDQGLLFDHHGQLLEGTHSNVLIAKGPDLLTPSLELAGVQGVLRAHLLDLGLISIAKLSEADLLAADQVYLINSVRGLQPLAQYSGLTQTKNWSKSPTSYSLQLQALLKYVRTLFVV